MYCVLCRVFGGKEKDMRHGSCRMGWRDIRDTCIICRRRRSATSSMNDHEPIGCGGWHLAFELAASRRNRIRNTLAHITVPVIPSGRRRPPCRDTKQPREAHNTPITDHRSSETPVTRSFSSTHAPNLMNQTSTRFTMWLILRSSFRSWIYPPIFPSVTDVDVQRLRCRRGQPCCFPRPGACELLAWRKRL